MTTPEERDAIEYEYERTLVCVKDCEAYDLKRQADDDHSAEMEILYQMEVVAANEAAEEAYEQLVAPQEGVYESEELGALPFD